jgi:hypothetical protein
LNITANFTGEPELSLAWLWTSQGGPSLPRAVRLLPGALIGAFAAPYFRALPYQKDSFTWLSLVALAVAGVLAGITGRDEPSVFACVSMTVFAAALRLFLLVKLDALRSHDRGPSARVLFLSQLLFMGYAVVDAWAQFERRLSPTDSAPAEHGILKSEAVLARLHGVYILVCIGEIIAAVATFDPARARRFVFFVVVVAVTIGATVLTQVASIFFRSSVRAATALEMSAVVHCTVAATLLFMLMRDDGIKYTEISKAPVPLRFAPDVRDDGS